jgi:hypothetical protein
MKISTNKLLYSVYALLASLAISKPGGIFTVPGPEALEYPGLEHMKLCMAEPAMTPPAGEFGPCAVKREKG